MKMLAVWYVCGWCQCLCGLQTVKFFISAATQIFKGSVQSLDQLGGWEGLREVIVSSSCMDRDAQGTLRAGFGEAVVVCDLSKL